MSSAFILNVGASVAGPALELARRISQPTSRSRPHITVRFTANIRETPEIYTKAEIEEVHLSSVGAFLPYGTQTLRGYPQTVFVECESDELDALSYKPDYPDSIFHLTVYDGPPDPMSQRLLEALREYPWGLVLKLPKATRLEQVSVGAPRDRSKDEYLSAAALELASDLLDIDTSLRGLASLSEEDRLYCIRQLCRHLHRELPSVKGEVQYDPPHSIGEIGERTEFALWGDADTPEALVRSGKPDSRTYLKKASLYLTPPELAQEMISCGVRLLPESNAIRFGDPSFGNGIFFASLLRHAGGRRISSALGIEVDHDRARRIASRWSGRGLTMFEGEFLDYELKPSCNFIASNPPYRRFQDLDRRTTSQWRAAILRQTGIDVGGRADLYVYFLLHAHQWMEPDAIAVWLLPGEFAQTQYGAAVRHYLAEKVTLETLHFYDQNASQFENARITSIAVIFRNSPPTDDHVASVGVGGSLESPAQRQTVDVGRLRRSGKWTPAVLALSDQQGEGPTRRSSERCEVRQLFRVQRGIATGGNKWFVLDHDQVKALGVEQGWVKPLIPRSRFLTSNVVESNEDGEPLVEPRRWLLDLDLPMAEIIDRAPKLAAYLRRVKSEVGDGALVRSRKPFYKQEQRPPPPFFFSYMNKADSKRLSSRFFRNCSQGVILNHYLALYPLADLAGALAADPSLSIELHAALMAIERSVLDAHGRSYVGGLAKLEPSEVGLLPLQLTGRLPDIVDQLLLDRG